MNMKGKSITYVTAHCHYLSLNIFLLQVLALFAIRSILSGLKKKLCFLKSEYDQEMSQSQTNQQYCEEETQSIKRY